MSALTIPAFPTEDVVFVLENGSRIPAKLAQLDEVAESTKCFAGRDMVEVLDGRGSVLFSRNDHGELVRSAIADVSPTSLPTSNPPALVGVPAPDRAPGRGSEDSEPRTTNERLPG